MQVVEVFESRHHKAVSFLVEREKVMQEWNEQKLPRCCLVTVEEGCQEETQKKKAEKKDSLTRTVRKGTLGKSLKKWLRVSRRRQARRIMPRRLHSEQLGKE